MTLNDYVNKLSITYSPNEFKCLLEEMLDEKFQNTRSQSKLIRTLSELLVKKCSKLKFLEKVNYRIIPKNASLIFLLTICVEKLVYSDYKLKEEYRSSRLDSFYSSKSLINGFFIHMKHIIGTIDCFNLQDNEGSGFQDINSIEKTISDSKINNVFSNLEELYTNEIYFNKLTLIEIPYFTEEFNSTFDDNYNCIIVSKNKENYNPEYILMHEFGHYVQCKLSGNSTEVPKDFLERTGLQELYCCNDGQCLELFADLFSYKVMEGTYLETKNDYYNIIRKKAEKDGLQKFLNDAMYFQQLVTRVK